MFPSVKLLCGLGIILNILKLYKSIEMWDFSKCAADFDLPGGL